MSEALAVLDVTKPGKVPRIPRKMRHALDRLADGRAPTIKSAAEQAGMSREWLSKSLNKLHVRQYLEARSERARELLKSQAPPVLLYLMENAQSERLRAEIALRASGIGSKDGNTTNLNLLVTPGYIVKLPATEGPVIEHQRQDEAKPLIEHEDGGDT